MRSSIPLLLVLALVACDDEASDAPATTDSMAADTASDGREGVADATPDRADPDAEPEPDAAEPEPDLGPEPDAEPDPDLGPDAGPEPDAEADAAVEADAEADAGPDAVPDAGEVVICGACSEDVDCAALGEGATCNGIAEPRFCVPGCDEQRPCQENFACIFNRCIPAGGRCDGCALEGCEDEERCDAITGQCAPKLDRCAACANDNDCGPDLECREFGFARNCLARCNGPNQCGEGFGCQGGTCIPESGACDACGGCVGETPSCDGASGQCQQCGFGFPCPAGQLCNAGACEMLPDGVECNASLDCQAADRPFCVEQACIGCRDNADCPGGQVCGLETSLCEDAGVCAGLTCQAGTECVVGRCATEAQEPGCQDDADCPGDILACNAATGQCYRTDQRCDVDGATAVCAPGSECRPDPLNANQRVCTCLKTNVGDAFEPNDMHRVPCQPGGVCWQIGDGPGSCVPAPPAP